MAQRAGPQRDPNLGRTLCGTYRLERLIRRGGMGAVYEARHVRTGGRMAAKLLLRDAAEDEDLYRRFQDEARITSSLHHPNIVQIFDFNEDEDGTPFLIMELLHGEDLHDRLHRAARLPLPQVLQLAREVGGALLAAHAAGVVHRDLKPQNIFLFERPLAGRTEESAKVLDFGISKVRQREAPFTQDQALLGTPQYMSPEQARGEHSVLDGRTDQFSLGVILYRALSGQPPFRGDANAVLYQVVHREPEPLGRLCPELPPQVAAAVHRALSKEREARFPSMNELVAALEDGCEDGPVIELSAAPGETAAPAAARQQSGGAVAGPGVAPAEPPGPVSEPSSAAAELSAPTALARSQAPTRRRGVAEAPRGAWVTPLSALCFLGGVALAVALLYRRDGGGAAATTGVEAPSPRPAVTAPPALPPTQASAALPPKPSAPPPAAPSGAAIAKTPEATPARARDATPAKAPAKTPPTRKTPAAPRGATAAPARVPVPSPLPAPLPSPPQGPLPTPPRPAAPAPERRPPVAPRPTPKEVPLADPEFNP